MIHSREKGQERRENGQKREGKRKKKS